MSRTSRPEREDNIVYNVPPEAEFQYRFFEEAVRALGYEPEHDPNKWGDVPARSIEEIEYRLARCASELARSTILWHIPSDLPRPPNWLPRFATAREVRFIHGVREPGKEAV